MLVSRHGRALALICSVASLPAGAYAQPRPIDSQKSTITVKVSKAGVFGGFGHDHEIAAPVADGSVDVTAKRVNLRVRAGSLRVRDPNASDKDREEIQKTIVGPEVLDVERYPEISFRASSAESSGPQAWRVVGELTLHGQSRPLTVEVREETGHFVGSAAVRQSEFGMKPIKIAGGTIKVKDEVRVDFDIYPAR